MSAREDSRTAIRPADEMAVLAAGMPLTLDGSVWYPGRSFAALGSFAALRIGASYASLGGKPLFGKVLLDD